MQGTYDAIGRLASAAHANGDKIEENIRPDGDSQTEHGMDIVHRGQLIQLRTTANEPRFYVDLAYPLSSRLKETYTTEEISQRAEVNFGTLSAEQQEQVVESVVIEDLESAQRYEDTFRTAVQTEVCPTQLELLSLAYGSEELWNGIVMRDYLFPYDESFDVVSYRDTIQRLEEARDIVSKIAHREIPVLNGDESPPVESPSDSPEEITGFQ